MKRTMAEAFNEWLRLYTESPETFEREFQTVDNYLAEKANGQEPTYGQHAAAFLHELMGEQQ